MLILFSRLYTQSDNQEPPVWVVNTMNNCHSRYTNYNFKSFFKLNDIYYGCNDYGIYKLSGSVYSLGKDNTDTIIPDTTIDAKIDTVISDFNQQETKAVEDAIVNARCDGEMTVEVSVNEQDFSDPFTITYQDQDGVYRKRVKIPRGYKGTNYQFRIRNDNGSDFTLFDFEVRAKTHKRIV